MASSKSGGKNPVGLSEIEASLERLMPRGLGEETRVELELVVDDLVEQAQGFGPRAALSNWQSWAAVLAVTALGVGFYVQRDVLSQAPSLAQAEATFSDHGIEVLEQMTWIESGADLGVQALNQEGDVSRKWSYTGVEEERLLHEDSGYEVILQRGFEAELYAASSL